MAEQRSLSPALWRVLVLLSLSLCINYIDRGNLSIAAPMLKEELHLSASQLGFLLSAFFWTYSTCLILSGWLVDRLGVKWVFGLGFLLWSAATAFTGLVHGFITLFVMRLILGAGESAAYPSYSRILSRHFTEERRGLANAVIASGKSCGPAIGTFAGGMLMARFGWRPFFIVLGLLSLSWLAPWFKWAPRESEAMRFEDAASPSILEILEQRSAWGTCGGLFCLNYLSYFMITWLPYYLVHERHFSMDRMAWTIAIAYLWMALLAPVAGWVSDRWIAAGGTTTQVRKTVIGVGQIGTGVALAACVVAPTEAVIFLLCLAAACFGICDSAVWAITQTLAGPHASGKWTGVQNFMGNLSGIVAPAVAGIVVDRTGNFFWAFAITGAVAVLGSLSWVFVIGPLREVAWKQPEVPVAGTVG